MEQMTQKFYVYILCNRYRNVIYVGCTDDLRKRIYFHKKRFISGFTKKYNVDRLVYYEQYSNLDDAMRRESQIKKYRREKKNTLVESENSNWYDLYAQIR